MKKTLTTLRTILVLVLYICIPIDTSEASSGVSIRYYHKATVKSGTSRKISHNLTATFYNACKEQCNDDFLVTADNSNIDLKKLKKLRIRWVAISRDLLKHYPYGSKIKVECDNKEFCGYWEVHDTMNERFRERIDFLLPEGETLGFTSPFKCKITRVN